MERIIKMDLFCEKCSLQFDKKVVFDIHMSFVHNISNNSANDKKLTEVKEENGSSQETDIAKQNENPAKQTVNHELEINISSVHEKQKIHECYICDKRYSHKSALKYHIASIHEGKKPHKCSICDYCCSTKSSLKKHVESIHEEQHKCSICDHSFSGKSYLKKHVQSVHEERKPHK